MWCWRCWGLCAWRGRSNKEEEEEGEEEEEEEERKGLVGKRRTK